MSYARIYLIPLIVVVAVVLSSCITSGLTERFDFLSSAEDENLQAFVAVHNSRDVELQLRNKTDQPLIIDWDSFAYRSPSGESMRVIHAGVRLIDRNQPQSRNTIAPNAQLSDMLVPSDAISYSSGKYGGWSTNPWAPIPPRNISFTIAYEIANQQRFLECSFTEDDIIRSIGRPIGHVSASKTVWHLFFINNPEGNREDLLKKAHEMAVQQYGQDIKITNPKYSSNWNIASLLLYFSMLGWVENASVTADVIRQ